MLGWKLTTAVAPSPDRAYRVELLDHQGALIDRNFDVVLEDLTTGQRVVIFKSPDEGQPIGTERFIWSDDSSQFLLVGRHFYTVPSDKLTSGETLYLHYDLTRGELKCNADMSSLPRFSGADLGRFSSLSFVPTPAAIQPASRSSSFLPR